MINDLQDRHVEAWIGGSVGSGHSCSRALMNRQRELTDNEHIWATAPVFNRQFRSGTR